MSKKEKDLKAMAENVSVVEETKPVQEEAKSVDAENQQPEPKTMNYDAHIQLTDKFLNDLVIGVQDLPYVQCEGFIRFAYQNKDDILISDFNEYMNKLQTLPWRNVHELMYNINRPEVRAEYFVVKQPQNNG